MSKHWLAALTVLLLLIRLVAGENPSAGAAPKFTSDFSDGSCLIGIPSFTSLEVESTLGTIHVPLEKIQNIEI